MIGNEGTLQNFKGIRLKLRFSHCYGLQRVTLQVMQLHVR